LKLSAKCIQSLNEVSPDEWNHLVNDENPFLTHEFLSGLENHDCLKSHNWYPVHIVIYESNKLIGALPLYSKTDSYGEFVFDWAWADAYQQSGKRYYPKLVSAIPFTPVCGQRILVDPAVSKKRFVQNYIINAALTLLSDNELSGMHCLFHTKDESIVYSQNEFLTRTGCQYHWFNEDYTNFDDFLGALNSKKRKQIKRERRSIRDAGIKIEVLQGDDIREKQWEIFYQFYCSTFYRKWGEPRLTLEFFKSLSSLLPDSTVLFLAKYKGDYIAGSYAMCSSHTLFGRHWGCKEKIPYLHFELCYYQTIEYCIKNGMMVLDAGAQGEYKISRGFKPVHTWSSHWIYDLQFRNAINDFLKQEQSYMENYIENIAMHSPIKYS